MEELESSDALPTWVAEAAYPCQLAGMTRAHCLPIFRPEGCLPDSVRTLIATDKGVRQLQTEELAHAKGVPRNWLHQGAHPLRLVNSLTDIHIWNAVASTLRQVAQPPTWTDPSLSAGSPDCAKTNLEPIPPDIASKEDLSDEEPWDWQPPDLTPGGPWHTAQVEKLHAATENLPNCDQLRSEGLEALEIHRANFESGEQKSNCCGGSSPRNIGLNSARAEA